MPTIAAYVEIPENQLRRVAEHVLQWIKKGKPKRKVQDFVERYNTLKDRMFPGEGVPHMHRWRVLQFTNLARGSPSRNVSVPRCREIEIIAAVVGVTVERLLGLEGALSRTRLDVMEKQENAAALLNLMRRYQPNTQDLIAWANFLPCSLETPAFMHAHHEALFGNPGDVMTWDGIGNTRRSELLAAGARRSWAMTQINFMSDLQRIADGRAEYADVAPDLRRECFDNLAEIVSNSALRIKLFVIDDTNNEEVAGLKCDLSDFDSVITWDDHLMIARDPIGINYYSDRPRHTGYWRGMLRELMALATFQTPEQVRDLLISLAASVPKESGEKETSADRLPRVS